MLPEPNVTAELWKQLRQERWTIPLRRMSQSLGQSSHSARILWFANSRTLRISMPNPATQTRFSPITCPEYVANHRIGVRSSDDS
jgi:hypothetical protein